MANIKAYSDSPELVPYVESSVQPTPADTGANFPTLDSNAAPSTFGVVVYVQDAARILRVETLPLTISSAQMTAGVTALANLYGASNTGVTASKNLAFVVSCTGLDLDSAIQNHVFDLMIHYESDLSK